MKLKRYGTLGLKNWGFDWACCWGFLDETALDDWESWLYEIRKADGKEHINEVERLYMLVRLTLLQFPRDWYAEQYAEDLAGRAPDVNALARLWYRLTHTPAEERELLLWEHGNRLRGCREQYELTQMEITAATPYALAEDGNRLRLRDETRNGYAVDEIYRELHFRNYAADAVAAGLLESLDAYAAGVPAAYL
jgi:hypothetical protein